MSEQPTPYEKFKKEIETILRSEPGGMTWTEIKNKLGLPQKAPNNLWVRMMERDIGLVRAKEKKGTIWKLK